MERRGGRGGMERWPIARPRSDSDQIPQSWGLGFWSRFQAGFGAFSSSWAHLKFWVSCDDVTLFVCACWWDTKTEKRSRPLLGIQSAPRPMPATEGAVSQSGSINLSAYPSKKKSSGAPGSRIRALARAQRAWGDPAGTKYTQLYTDMKNTQGYTYHSQWMHTNGDKCVTNGHI